MKMTANPKKLVTRFFLDILHQRKLQLDTNFPVCLATRATGRRFYSFASSSEEHVSARTNNPPPTESTPLVQPCHPAIVNVEGLANRMREQVRAYTAANSEVRLVGILAESGPYRADAEIYSERIHTTLTEDGIAYELCQCSGHSPADVEAVIRTMNQRADVHGILIFYPIFKSPRGSPTRTQSRLESLTKGPYLDRSTGVHYKTHDDYLRDIVSPAKDVEGLCSDYNARWIFRARAKNRSLLANPQVYIPCTALAVMKILETYHDYTPTVVDHQGSNKQQLWSGLKVTIVNRSEILGRPLAALLALEGATVFSVDDHSVLRFMGGGRMQRCPNNMTLQDCLQQSSVVVTGVPSPDFLLPIDSIAPGTTVVNVSEFSNVDEITLLEQCPNVKLIPHVGKVTVAALEQNLIRLHRQAIQGSSR